MVVTFAKPKSSYFLQSVKQTKLLSYAAVGIRIRRTYHHITQELWVPIPTNGRIPWRGTLPFSTAIHLVLAFSISRKLRFFLSS